MYSEEKELYSAMRTFDQQITASTARTGRKIVTTYYEYGKNPGKETEIKVTRAKWPDYATRNAFYNLTQNKYGAGVVVIHDESCFSELHCILTRDINGNVSTNFKRNPMRPLMLMED